MKLSLVHASALLLLLAGNHAQASFGFCHYHGPVETLPVTYLTRVFETPLQPKDEPVASQDFYYYLVSKGNWRPRESDLPDSTADRNCRFYSTSMQAGIYRKHQIDLAGDKYGPGLVPVGGSRSIVDIDFVPGRDKPTKIQYMEDPKVTELRKFKAEIPFTWISIEPEFYVDSASANREHIYTPNPGSKYPIEENVVTFVRHRIAINNEQKYQWQSQKYIFDCANIKIYHWEKGGNFRRSPADEIDKKYIGAYYKATCSTVWDREQEY